MKSQRRGSTMVLDSDKKCKVLRRLTEEIASVVMFAPGGGHYKKVVLYYDNAVWTPQCGRYT